jgi:hypothetical protein
MFHVSGFKLSGNQGRVTHNVFGHDPYLAGQLIPHFSFRISRLPTQHSALISENSAKPLTQNATPETVLAAA